MASKYDASASECTLIANILDGEFTDDAYSITNKVNPEDFLDSRNRAIYKGIISLCHKSEKVNLISVVDELKNLKLIEEAGGEDYITYISTTFASPSNISSSIDSVLDRSLLAQFVTKLKNICDEATSKSITTNISEFLAEKEAQILEISKKRRIADFTSMENVTSNIVTHLANQSENRKTRDSSIPKYVEGIPTGYEVLDKFTLGWQKGDMIIVGARPSVGKTAFALNLAYNVCKRGTPVLFFSLEMNDIRIGMRLLSKVTKLKQIDFANLDISKSSSNKKLVIESHDEENQIHAMNLERGIHELNGLSFYLDCNTSTGIMDIVSQSKKFKSQKPDLGLIIIDYLSLIRAPNNNGKENRNQEVAAISKQIKALAFDLQVPIIALSQLNRETEKSANHKPQMSDIRESGNIEQDADIVIMLYRKDYYDRNDKEGEENTSNIVANPDLSTVEAIIRKNRNGRTGTVKFVFDKSTQTFDAAADSEQEE